MTTSKPRYLGLEVGERRIGIAISDPQGVTAAGLETITRTTVDEDIATVADIAKRHHAVEIVIGLPLTADGQIEDEQSAKVMAFGKRLTRATGVPVIYEDERLTSMTAVRTLTVQTNKVGRDREMADRQAAAVILQKYLDSQGPPPSA